MLLFFNDISGSEVLVILIFILIFFGSKSIPGIARTFGRAIRQIKDASNDVQEEILKSGIDIKKDLNLNRFVNESATEFTQPLDQIVNDLNHSVKFEPARPVQEREVNIVADVMKEKPGLTKNDDQNADQPIDANQISKDSDSLSPSETVN